MKVEVAAGPEPERAFERNVTARECPDSLAIDAHSDGVTIDGGPYHIRDCGSRVGGQSDRGVPGPLEELRVAAGFPVLDRKTAVSPQQDSNTVCAGNARIAPGDVRIGNNRGPQTAAAGQPRAVLTHAWKAQHRLHQRFTHLRYRKQPQIAVVAVARELVGFL